MDTKTATDPLTSLAQAASSDLDSSRLDGLLKLWALLNKNAVRYVQVWQGSEEHARLEEHSEHMLPFWGCACHGMQLRPTALELVRSRPTCVLSICNAAVCRMRQWFVATTSTTACAGTARPSCV